MVCATESERHDRRSEDMQSFRRERHFVLGPTVLYEEGHVSKPYGTNSEAGAQ